MPAIQVANLVKTYRYHQKDPGLTGSLRGLFRRQTLERRAVDGVSFSIEPGEVVGFLGPNGAGKTTTLKVLCGLLYPTSGSASVLGHTPSRRTPEFLRQIALVMGQKNMLWWDVPALESLLLQQDMYGISDAAFRETLAELAEMLEVNHLLRVQVRKLSLGERMKMELLAALIHRPRILFLDEPTIGLDVISRVRVLVAAFLSGQVVPLALFPADLTGFLRLQPFRYTLSYPLEVLAGRLSPDDLMLGFALQVSYLALGWLIYRWVWRHGLRSYAAVGV